LRRGPGRGCGRGCGWGWGWGWPALGRGAARRWGAGRGRGGGCATRGVTGTRRAGRSATGIPLSLWQGRGLAAAPSPAHAYAPATTRLWRASWTHRRTPGSVGPRCFGWFRPPDSLAVGRRALVNLGLPFPTPGARPTDRGHFLRVPILRRFPWDARRPGPGQRSRSPGSGYLQAEGEGRGVQGPKH